MTQPQNPPDPYRSDPYPAEPSWSGPYPTHPVDPARPTYSYPPAHPVGGGYPPGPIYRPLPEHPQGTVVLVLGIVGFFVGVTGVVAWVLASRALNEIKTTGVRYANEQSLVIGRILGIISTIFMILGLVLGVIYLMLLFAFVASGTFPR